MTDITECILINIEEFNSESKSNKTVVFIPGYLKANHWNESEYGKRLGILTSISSKAKVLAVTFNEDIYRYSIPEICSKLTDKLSVYDSLCIVAHSYGCFVGLQLATVDKLKIRSLLLLDPITVNDKYFNYINTTNDKYSSYKITHYDLLPKPLQLKIAVSIILSYIEDLGVSIKYFEPLVKYNTLSSIEVCFCSHMIHYDHPEKIIHKIGCLLKS